MNSIVFNIRPKSKKTDFKATTAPPVQPASHLFGSRILNGRSSIRRMGPGLRSILGSEIYKGLPELILEFILYYEQTTMKQEILRELEE